jgi:ech hydrogenase subunit A
MQTLILCLFIVPFIISGLLLVAPKKIGRIITIGSVIGLSAISVYLYLTFKEPITIKFSSLVNEIVAGVDILLLLYFGFVAIKRKSLLVGIMSVLQLGTLIFLLFKLSHQPSVEVAQFYIDKLSLFMFLLINIISGVIAAFSLQYIDEEECSAYRKKFFMATIMWFIGVMNMIVSADNLEYFFLLFELTTLASFLLISFRKDEISVKNALTALWMNQIGGLAILGAMVYSVVVMGFTNLTFSGFIQSVPVIGLLPFALLAVAALIKGAQMPFSKWLLGAMVAPTPVSALLHSSTMVKIAPFIILRLSPALQGTPVATVIICLTAFVFLSAAISALAQNNFKRILAYSTISLLGLMIMMAAIGTPVAVIAALVLILFHGISKCMLFLNAGILERVFHLKESSDMEKLGETGPFTALVVAIGFMSLLLPPFGAFIGKWFSIETIGSGLADQKLIYALVLVAIACGGAILSLLYFKVLGLLITRTGKSDSIKFEKTHILYSGNIYILISFIFLGAITFPWLMGSYFAPVASALSNLSIWVDIDGTNLIFGTILIGTAKMPLIPMLIAFILLPLTLILAMVVKFKKVDRAKEYMCGEKIEYRFSSMYFSTDKLNPYFAAVGICFFVALIIVGAL